MKDDLARNRYLVISFTRVAGVAMVIVGLLVNQQAIEWPMAVGYVLIAVGIVDVFVAPLVLARKWRSPPE